MNLNSLHHVGYTDVKALAAPCISRNITNLNLRSNLMMCSNVVTDDWVTALPESSNFHKLTALDLRLNCIGDEGVRILAESPYLSNLTAFPYTLTILSRSTEEQRDLRARTPHTTNIHRLPLHTYHPIP